MANESTRRTRIPAAYPLLVALTVSNAGCLAVAAGAAGGAVAGYAYYKGKVSQEYNAGLEETLAATQAILAAWKMPVSRVEREASTAAVTTRTAEGEAVYISFDLLPGPFPAEAGMTRVGVRVATFGDPTWSERLLNQVAVQLRERRNAGLPAGAPTGITGATSTPTVGVAPAGFSPPTSANPAVPQTAEPPLLPAGPGK
jgi:hypothetical protein